METYTLAYCIYDPDGVYLGHRLHSFPAESEAKAEEIALRYLDERWVKARWEYKLLRGVTSFKIHDTRRKTKRAK